MGNDRKVYAKKDIKHVIKTERKKDINITERQTELMNDKLKKLRNKARKGNIEHCRKEREKTQ